MKLGSYPLLALFFLLSANAQEQANVSDEVDYPVIDFVALSPQGLEQLNIPQAVIDQAIENSRQSLLQMFPDRPELINHYEVQGVDVVLPVTSLVPPTPQTHEAMDGLANLNGANSFGVNCANNVNNTSPDPTTSLVLHTNDIIQHIEGQNFEAQRFNPGQLYIIWGYNRAWHSRSDATFTTPDGTFTVRDARGEDRPTTTFTDYIHPTKWLIPQYNFRIGYQLNPKWSVEVGTDHMKWIFDNTQKYEIEGEYNRLVFNDDPNDHDGMTFDEVKQTGNLNWLTFEHSDGYNYFFVASTYTKNILASKDNKFRLDGIGGAGLGLMVPKTKVVMHQDEKWNHVGNDNRFHVAGYGGHTEVKLRGSYRNFFAEFAGRYTLIKIDNALVDTNNAPDARLEHSPISSIELVGGVGYRIPFKRKKRLPAQE